LLENDDADMPSWGKRTIPPPEMSIAPPVGLSAGRLLMTALLLSMAAPAAIAHMREGMGEHLQEAVETASPASQQGGLLERLPTVQAVTRAPKGVTLPAGTLLWLRLETSASTIASHLNEPVTARTVREVSCGGGVAIPLGSSWHGRIDKLIPSSNPADRARLLLRFTGLDLPDGSSLKLFAHLTEVDNAREAVLPDGTIRGLLESELPVSQLQAALAKLSKKDPETGGQIQKTAEETLGKGSTAIELPAGADLTLALDKPLVLGCFFAPSVPDGLEPEVLERLARVLSQSPARTEGKSGRPGDPLNVVIVGSAVQIRQAFQEAGWSAAERKNDNAIWQTVRAIARNAAYGAAPVSDLYLYGRREDLAFEKTLNTFTKRHHLRLWRSPVITPDGREIWVGAATHDTGFEIRPGVASHAIDPDLDAERAKVGADLEVTGLISREQFVRRAAPLTQGITVTGAVWKTDGRLLAVELKGGP
jgi:hypothetical protein